MFNPNPTNPNPNQSAEFQEQFAQAIRQAKPITPFFEEQSERLAVYIRLIRNNIHNFLDKCYTQTPKFCEPNQWANWKEQFVQNGQAQTPYFQEIAGEFLDFCQNQLIDFPENLLELMNFEYSQLRVEVFRQAEREKTPENTSKNTFKLAPTTHIGQYSVNVLGELETLENPLFVLVWRNLEDDVFYQPLDEFNRILLEILAENALNLDDVLAILAEFMPTSNADLWQNEVRERWHYWQNQGVIIPINPTIPTKSTN